MIKLFQNPAFYTYISILQFIINQMIIFFSMLYVEMKLFSLVLKIFSSFTWFW